MKLVYHIILISGIIISNCKADDLSPKLLVAATTHVGILDTATGDMTWISNNNKWVMFVDYHYVKQYMFWSDNSNGNISRISYPLTGTESNAEVIIRAQNPLGIAVDQINDHIYWTDAIYKKIFRSDLDGGNTIEILNVTYGTVRDIALDIENGWMYFNNGRLEKSRLDGTERQVVINANGNYENIALDFDLNRIYWVDYYPQKIKSSFLDGSDIREIITLTDRPMGLEIVGSYMYYSLVWKKTITRILKNGNGNPIEIFSNSTGNIMSLKRFADAVACSQYKTIENEDKRSVDYATDTSVDKVISDDTLVEAWYRFKGQNGDRIPTFPPGILHCGTLYPIWLNGSFPTTRGINATTEVCVQTSLDTCEESYNITITDCGPFHVYYLKNTTKDSAYCFGSGPVRCAEGLSSESGYYPGCSSSFPNETVSPVVKAVLIDGPILNLGPYGPSPSPSLKPVFNCEFDDVSNGTYVYDIYWYINGDYITVFKNFPFSDINETMLHDTHWINSYHMNMEVQCSLRIRNSIGSIPGPFYQSPMFKAGLYPEKYKYTVTEGEPINITFTSTVPVGCYTSLTDIRAAQCFQNILISQPKFDSDSATCSNNIANRDIVFSSCGIKIGSIDWNETNYLQVYGFSDGLYNQQDRRTYILLSTKVGTIWQNLQVPHIQVNVLDKDSVLTTRVCQSYNDPHITTYDGKTYHYMEVGEFVMYRNDRGPYWVHALFTNCGYGWAGSSCHCGVAVRSRRSLFVLRTCDRISRTKQYLLPQPITDVRSCGDSDLSIEHTSNYYKITLPIGTEIQFSISQWSKFITNISIKPSIYDINMAKGLCGVPSETKDISDDFTHRQLGPVNDEKSFADSWRINSTTTPDENDEQLFVPEPVFLFATTSDDIDVVVGSNITQERYCTCEKEAGPSEDIGLFNALQCNLTESTQSCPLQDGNDNSISAFVTTCSSGYRIKRSIDQVHRIQRRSTLDTDDIVDMTPLEYDEDTNTQVSEPEFRNGWTEAEANKTCYERIHQAIPDDLFGEMTGLTDSDYIESCILDIKLTADTSFVQDTVGAMQTYTIMEVLRNETLSVMKTGDGNQTILEYLTSQLCPNNCSENGNCTKGLCSCFDGYIGVDCSQDISQPPLHISLPAEGLCGTRSRACRRTNIYGTFLTKDVWCRKRHFQLINDTRIYTAKPVVIKADYRNTFMVSVDLEGSRRKRSVDATVVEGYDLSLSNDGERFGENISIIIYDEDCFNCNSSSSICVLLDTCPLHATSTALATTSEVITTQPDTAKKQSTTTTEKEITKQSTSNTVSTPVHDPSTTLMTTTEQETTQQTTTAKVSTTKEKQTTSQTTTPKPTIEQLTSYIGPIVLGASIVILLVIVAIICVCLKFKRGKQSPRFQDEQTRNITQFNSWNIYKGSSSIVSKDMQAEKQWKIYNGNRMATTTTNTEI